MPQAGLRPGFPALACTQSRACTAGNQTLVPQAAQVRQGRCAERRASLHTPASFAGAR